MKRLSILALVAFAACATYDPNMSSSGTAGMPGGARMSASDIAAIVTAANEGEVQQGQAAAARAASSAVRDFANMMVSDHTNALSTARGVFERNGIAPNDNDTSRTLRSNSQAAVAALNTYSGAAFDRTYMQSQVDLHQWLLTQLDNVLIPSSRGDLRTLLTAQRAAVAAHLDRARTILGSL